MKPEAPKTPREELESKLTALLLGELPDEQAFLLKEIIQRDPELANVHEQLKKTIELVRETEQAPEKNTSAERAQPKLSEERRQQLLAHFKTVKPREFAAPPRARFAPRPGRGLGATGHPGRHAPAGPFKSKVQGATEDPVASGRRRGWE